MDEMKMPVDMYEFLADEEKKRFDELSAKVKAVEDNEIERKLRDCVLAHVSLEDLDEKGAYEIFYYCDLRDIVIPLMLEYGAARVNEFVIKIVAEIAETRKLEAGARKREAGEGNE